MQNLCDIKPVGCFSSGKCAVDISLNTTYCQCTGCDKGPFCETELVTQAGFNLDYIFFIIYNIQLCLSVLNNGLVLELFIRCKRVYTANCGIYLMVYAILSFLSCILLAIFGAIEYYSTQIMTINQYLDYRCYAAKIGYKTLTNVCMLLSACIVLERGFIIFFKSKINNNRWRSCIVSIILLGLAVGGAIPMIVYKCEWGEIQSLHYVRYFISWLYFMRGIIVYLLATVFVLISFAYRIRRYGMENGSYMKTLLKLFSTHLFIFIPPIAIGISQLPYTIAYNTSRRPIYYYCDITIVELIIKTIVDAIQGISYVLTWLIFVYPSKVYMTEFYLNTRSGQSTARIILFIKSFSHREKN